ncbi:MAG: SDR family NAD(P)-dependent oxidoreductase [Parvibaculales bacterium]
MVTRIRKNPIWRMRTSMLGQQKHVQSCPDLPLLTDRVAVITGATSCIGKETARGLLTRGAEVIALCRNTDKAEVVRAEFVADGLNGEKFHIIEADMGVLSSLPTALAAIKSLLQDRQIDMLIENAGVWLRHYAETADGLEQSFATNVLGHFALRRGLLEGMLAPHARVIAVTGDIYVMADQCTPQFRWRGAVGGMKAYNRSKLGVFWLARELQRRESQLNVFIVHPGVVASNLAMPSRGLVGWLRRKMMISCRDGAQTPLICATQDNLSHGSYYHNVHGEVELANNDPAMNDRAAAQLWADCEHLTDTLFAA